MSTSLCCRSRLTTCLNFLLHISCVLFLISPTPARCQDTGRPLVFCHFMLNSFLYSDDVAGLSREIQLAQQHGIDAFALNIESWDSTYQTRADNLYQAAENLNFKLFFSADFNVPYSTLTLAGVHTMLTRYANYSSQLRYQGKQFFSTFSGKTTTLSPYSDPLSTWRDGVLAAAGGNIFFAPYFETTGQQDDITSVINQFSTILDGLLAWDTSGWPYVNGDYNNPSDAADRAYLAACGAAGIVYIAAMSPWFYRTDIGIRGNYAGDGLWRTHWEQLIALQPPLVEILTWNDWAERHYVVSVPAGDTPPGAAENNDLGFPHLPFLDLASRYYIPWLKTGQKPTITKEVLYIFYCTQSKNGSTVPNVGWLDDRLYATVLLRQAADVQLMSGTQRATFENLQPGLQNVSMAFSEGTQSASLVRGGTIVLNVTGTLPVSAPSSSPDFNVYSAQAQ